MCYAGGDVSNRVKPVFLIPRLLVFLAIALGTGCGAPGGYPGARAWGLKPRSPDAAITPVGRRSTRGNAPTSVPVSADPSALPVPNPYYRNRTANATSRRRQDIVRKLKTMTLDKVAYPGIPLGEVVRHLNEESIRLDPEGRGINFLVLSPAATSEANARDPAGAPVAPGNRIEEADLENALVRLDPPLHDLSLIHALDAITKTAETSIQFAVTDYAVVIWPKTSRDPVLFQRSFRSSPGVFQQGLEGVQGGAINP